MIEMNALRLEINNLLHLIELILSKKDRIKIEYLITRLLKIYFDSKLDMNCESHIESVYSMIYKLKTINNSDCQLIEEDTSNLMALLEQLAFEHCCS